MVALAAALLPGLAAEGQESPSRPPALSVKAGQSRIVDAPWPVARVAVSDPKIADAQALTPQRVLLLGKAIGKTDLMLWNQDEEMRHYQVAVEADLEHMRGEVAALLPGGNVTLSQTRDAVVLSGTARRVEELERLRSYLDSTGMKYIDTTTLAGVPQVQLQVRVAEASRTAIRALGFNGFIAGNDFLGGVTIGPDGGGALNPVSIGLEEGTRAAANLPFVFTSDTGVGSAVTLFGGIPDWDLQFFLQALSENQYLRVLAEPVLVALSGEEASFLAGGEFPIPIVQGGSADGTSITIEYKEFGVRLRFRPTVMGDGSIRLNVAPEVSELTDAGAVVIEGFRVPALVTRRAETTLSLHSGQTFGMAGLISRSVTARSSRVPWLGDVPVLGTLFRSTRYTSGETELLVLVRASLVEPLSLEDFPPAPGLLHQQPDDWELYGLGRIQGQAPVAVTPPQAEWMRRIGLEQLKGPGAWVTYDTRPAAPPPTAAPARRGPSRPAPSQPMAPPPQQTRAPAGTAAVPAPQQPRPVVARETPPAPPAAGAATAEEGVPAPEATRAAAVEVTPAPLPVRDGPVRSAPAVEMTPAPRETPEATEAAEPAPPPPAPANEPAPAPQAEPAPAPRREPPAVEMTSVPPQE